MSEKTNGGLYGYSWLVTTNAGGRSHTFWCEYNEDVPDAYSCPPTDDGANLEVTSFSYSPTSLRADPKEYRFTDRDGTEYIYQSVAIQLGTADASGAATLKSILYPNGEKITGYTSNLGFNIGIAASGGSGNMSRTYTLNKGATALGTLSMVETFTQDSVGAGSSTIVETDALSRTFVSNWATPGYGCTGKYYVTSFTRPGGLQTTLGYSGIGDTYGTYRVSSVARGGQTWAYANANNVTTVTDPGLVNTQVTASPTAQTEYFFESSVPCGVGRYEYGRVTKVKDALLRETNYAYSWVRSPTSMTQP